MLWSDADERAAVVFDDLSSALDAGLPLAALGGDPAAGDRALHGILGRRGVELSPTEQTVLEHAWRSGRASAALRTRAVQRRRRAAFRRTIWAGLRYPLALFAMLLVASIACGALLGWHLPLLVVGAYALAAVCGFALARAIRRGRVAIDRWPLLGPLYLSLAELPYLETLAALYGAGVAIRSAHPAAVEAVGAPPLRARLSVADRLLQAGEPLRDALATAAALDLETRMLVSTGESTGQLEEALQRAAERRSSVAARHLAAAAHAIGRLAYAIAAIAVAVFVIRFYTHYFSQLRPR